MSLNPLDYHPAQIAKALVALLTSVISVLGVLAATLATGGLAQAGGWVTGAAAVLTPILVFLQKAQPVIGALDAGAAVTPLAKLDPNDPAQHNTE